MTGRNEIVDDKQDKLMGKFRPIVPMVHEEIVYERTVHYDGSVQKEGNLGERDMGLAELCDEVEFYFKNTTQKNYKGRVDIRIRLEEK